MASTTDRGVIMHLAGARGLSPALRDGRPAFAEKGDGAGRCGWAPFFRALEARRQAVTWEGEGDLSITPRPPRA